MARMLEENEWAEQLTGDPDAIDLQGEITRLVGLYNALRAKAQPTDRDAWISVDERKPEKYCLAVYETASGKQRIIRAMYVAKFTVEAQGDDCYSEINDENDTEYLREGWYELIDNWGEYSSVHVTEGVVTHWQPLPELPGTSGSTTEGAGS